MHTKTKGIVLHQFKYSDSSVIAQIFTREQGKISFLIQGSHRKKSNTKYSYLQALYILDMEIDVKHKRDLQRIKEFKPALTYNSIPFDIQKITIAQFIAELLYKTLPEHEPNTQLFDYLLTLLPTFDEMQEGTSSFHLYFLARYLQFTGFAPELNFSEAEPYFSHDKARFVGGVLAKSSLMEKEESEIFAQLMSNSTSVFNYKIERKTRQNLIEKILEYYYLHFQALRKIQSLEVLQQVFE